MRSAELAAMRKKLATVSTTGRDHEEMSPAKWKQTAKDLPVAIGASALGWGIGKTLGDVVLQQNPDLLAKSRKYGPVIGSALGGLGSYAYGKRQGILRERREQAHRQKQSAAPQSRKVPRARRKDPWRYNDRGAFFLGLM